MAITYKSLLKIFKSPTHPPPPLGVTYWTLIQVPYQTPRLNELNEKKQKEKQKVNPKIEQNNTKHGSNNIQALI